MFKFDARTQVIVSENLSATVAEIVQCENAGAVGLLIDQNVARIAKVKTLIDDLTKRVKLCPKFIVSQEPTTDLVDQATAEFRGGKLDLFIGIGGGSTLDLAKAVSVMAVNPGNVTDYHGTGKEITAGIKKIMIPTTAGTGSEVTPGAVLVNPRTFFKRALGGWHVCPDYAILDASLTFSMPDFVTASTGMDALTHTIESYTAKCANRITRMYSREAFSLIFNNLPKAFLDKTNIEARRNLLIGSCLAGYAIYNSNTGACHSMAYPLGIYHGVPHGAAIGLLMPKVLEVNVAKGCTMYADLYDLIEGIDKNGSAVAKTEHFLSLLQDYAPRAHLDQNLKRYGVTGEAIPFLSERSLDLTSALNNNPVEFNREDAIRVLDRLV